MKSAFRFKLLVDPLVLELEFPFKTMFLKNMFLSSHLHFPRKHWAFLNWLLSTYNSKPRKVPS